MAKLTMVFGVLLIVVGVIGFVTTGSAHPTALIPSAIGLILGICGSLAHTEDLKRRALWIHIAVTVGLLGFLGTIKGAIDVMALAKGAVMPEGKAIAVEEKAATCLFCLLFTAFCIRNFIENKRARTLAG